MLRPSLMTFLLMLCWSGNLWADTIRVAVAANFYPVMNELIVSFEKDHGHQVELVTGSSGKLASQIIQGAPFDLFLSADADRPMQLEKRKLIVQNSRQGYAKGRLALLANYPKRSDIGHFTMLKNGDFERISIANPDLAPYGRAAQQSLEALDKAGIPVKGQLVRGENVAQAFHFFRTGHVDFAFVSASQIIEYGVDEANFTLIPATYHEPIEQQMVLLSRKNGAADLYIYLLSEAAQKIISHAGYQTVFGHVEGI